METVPKYYCFVLMPFDEAFDDIYNLGIKEACNSVGAYCERVDEQIFQETIINRVYNQISKADLIIADMTNRNPNVFYEVGYAHALGKPTILLTQKTEDIPFDLKHFQHIVYNNKIGFLKDELTKRILWYSENPKTNNSLSKIRFDIYLDKYNLLHDKVTFVNPKNMVPYVKFTLFNPTPYYYEPGSFRIGVISPEKYSHCRGEGIVTIKLPSEKYMHMLPYLDAIFPESYSSFKFILSHLPDENKSDEFIVRIFSEFGTMDYPFLIEQNSDLDKYLLKSS